MNSKTIGILAALLAASAGTTYLMQQKRTSAAATAGKLEGSKLVKDFSLDALGSFSVQDTKTTLTIKKEGSKWVVADRENFPASPTMVNTLTDNAENMTIGSATEVDASDYGRIQVADPVIGGDDKTQGVAVSLKTASGSDISSFILGKVGGKKDEEGFMGMPPPGSGGAKPQWVRLKGAAEIYEIRAAYSGLKVDPKFWLDKENFLKVEKLKSVNVKGADATDTWSVMRETEGGELKLADVRKGEQFDPTGKAAPVGTALSFASFEDIALSTTKEKWGLDKPSRVATLETFDGFAFVVNIGNKIEAPAGDATGDTYYMNFSAAGSFAETRAAAPLDKDGKSTETEEQKKSADEAFGKELVAKKEKLANLKVLKDRVFVVTKYQIEPFLKNRTDLMKDATPPAGGEGGPGAGVVPQIMPGKGGAGKIEAVTPPISVDVPPPSAKNK